MMLRSSSNLVTPRKVVVYYLLFSLIALACLTASILYSSHSVMGSRVTSSCLSRIAKTSAALELEYLRNGAGNLQSVLQGQLESSPGIQGFSVVSLEGTALAHSDSKQIGQKVPEKKGGLLRWQNVSGIQYQNDNDNTISEYQVPLVANKEHFGSLRITIQQPSLWSNLAEIMLVASLFALIPLGLIALGGFYLARLISPMAIVDSQLRTIARQRPTVDVHLQELPAKDVVSMGWNRLVDLLGQNQSNSSETGLQNRLAEAVAAREQSQYHRILQNITDGVAVTDIEGRITFANRAVAALLGGEPAGEELQGAEFEEKIIEALADNDQGSLFEETSAHCTAITEVKRVDGTQQRTLRVARQPMEGELSYGHVWSVRDITQQKLAEQTRDQFINVATHELRTPLSNIKAYAETLATCDEVEVEQQKEFCNIINSEVTRLARFVDDLLCISSMETGSLTVDRKQTIASRMFEEVQSRVQPLMQKKQIDFVVHLPEKMNDLQIDKDKIVAVLVNLLGNAAKYTPTKGRVSLRVNLDAANLQIAVQDTGVGIAAEELDKVFDKFFRSSDPRVQDEIGTGLGLSLAREVVRMHGGEITVESQIDQGTTFLATIPIL